MQCRETNQGQAIHDTETALLRARRPVKLYMTRRLPCSGPLLFFYFHRFALHEAPSFPTSCVPVVLHNFIRIPLLVGLPSLLPPRLMRPHCHIPTTHSVPNSNHTNIAQCCRPYACLIPMRLFDVSQAGWVQALSLVGDSRPVIPTPARCAAPSP